MFYVKFNDLIYSGPKDIIQRSNPYRKLIPIFETGRIQNTNIDCWQKGLNITMEFMVQLLNACAKNQFDKMVLQLIVPSTENPGTRK